MQGRTFTYQTVAQSNGCEWRTRVARHPNTTVAICIHLACDGAVSTQLYTREFVTANELITIAARVRDIEGSLLPTQPSPLEMLAEAASLQLLAVAVSVAGE